MSSGKSTFVPRRFLATGHLQTLAGNYLPRPHLLPAPEKRLFQVEPEVQVLCHCHWQPDRAHAFTVIVVHGLEGSSESQYMYGVGSKAWTEGMNVVRMNMRTCGGTEALSPTLYHNGLGADVGAVVEELIRTEKLERVAMVGYSMGGNLVLYRAGTWGKDAPPQLKAVATVSPSMDLAASADALSEAQNLPYQWHFVRRLKQRFHRKAALHPERYDATRTRGVRTIREFDDQITAPYSGFGDADEYYQRCSSAQYLDRVAIPTLILHALDDPFIRVSAETRALALANPNITYIESEHGGHCAFLADPNGYDGRWAEREIVAFLAQF
ncbi:MAG: alpha/beta fold hydrolase [Acidobacteriota bacterium]|nr:alpha/beta fold hydrolase [Acidobacteriota bacterium]